ncbi:MAG: ABC transporter substrate-binding protein [Clostridiales bacterium]|nr:ABC transporter substrate-binding protein [Clostridiales bacterium]
MSYIKANGPAGPLRGRRKGTGRLTALLLCLILLAALPGCGSKKQPVLTVGVLPDLDSIPLMTAAQSGYLPDNIHLEVYKSPVDRDSALYSGHLDGAVSDLAAACLAAANGQPYKALSVTDGCYRLVAAGKTDIRSIQELRGKRVGLSVNTVIEYAADRLLKAGGLSPDQVEKTAVPSIPTRLELLSAGKLEAAVLPEPYASAAIAAGGRPLGSSADLQMDAGLLLFSEKTLSQKQDLLAALLRGYNQAVRDLNSGAAAPAAAADALGLPASLTPDQLPAYRPAVLPGEADVAAAAGWLADKTIIAEPPAFSAVCGDLERILSRG